MWILILTLAAYSSQGGSGVAAVNGFRSEGTCFAAGNAWLKQQSGETPSTRKTALCVRDQ